MGVNGRGHVYQWECMAEMGHELWAGVHSGGRGCVTGGLA